MSAVNRLEKIIFHLTATETSNYNREIEHVFITGCSRGIGYGLVEHFLKAKNNQYFVIATCRSPNKAVQLQSLLSQYADRSKLMRLDVSNETSIIRVFQQIIRNQLLQPMCSVLGHL